MSKSKKRNWKAMLAEHVEKGVFGIAILVMLYFFTNSFKAGITDQQKPEKLEGLVKNAKEVIDRADKLPPGKFVEKDYATNSVRAFRPD